MNHAFCDVLSNLEQSKSIVSQHMDAAALTRVQSEIQQRIADKTLQVMLYGSYNAGKSTLVNALLGTESAVVNDIPTTDSIDCYEWNGYHLLDTPGVNAPIEHENTTNEQIKRTSAILFVIREGDQDAKDVYERLFDMVKQGKHVFIVLNHQLTNIEDKIASHRQIMTILCQLASQYGISEEQVRDIQIYPMNVKTALTGRLKHSDKLLEHSGYLDFIAAFSDWVQEQETQVRLLEEVKGLIHNLWYTPALESLSYFESDSGKLRTLNDECRQQTAQQNALKIEARSYISHEVTLSKSEVSQILRSSTDQAQFDSRLQSLFSPLYSEMETWVQNQLGQSSSRLLVDLSSESTMTHHDLESVSNPIVDNALSQMRQFVSNEGNLKEALLMGRKLKIPGLKGRWEKTLGQWAGRAAIAIQVVTFFWDTYSAHSEQEKQNQAQRQQAIEVHQAVEQICNIVIRELTKSVSDMIDAFFNAQRGLLEEQVLSITESDEQQKQEHHLLQKFANDLDTIVL
ncbi:TPA: GTPase [Photobacterium damselae]